MAKIAIKKVSLKRLSKEREKRKIGKGDGGVLTEKTLIVRR